MKIVSIRKILITLAAALLSTASYADMEEFISVPPLLGSTEDALVMLVMSNDNQLWHKAYTDYSDLDGDGTLDTTYNDGFEYYGYFDSEFCYSYSSGIFVPNGKVVRALSESTATLSTPDHKCTSATGKWSGNFMNWLTMTRVDVIRKVLYGGYRLTDTPTKTVLQRALLPDDNHSFVKVVRDAAIDGQLSDYTPISGEDVVSFCNVTDPDNTSSGSMTSELNVANNPPRLKIAPGDYFTWSGSERELCLYEDEASHNDANPFIPERPSASSISGVSEVEFKVRVETCVVNQDRDNCREYTGSGNNTYYKPYGLLQTYGENGGLKFGLMTGSYAKNDAGGVLRKNVSYMGGSEAAADDKEVNISTGQFINQSTADTGIINTLNRLRISGWDYDTNFYEDCNTWGIPIYDFLNSSSSNRQCRDWGNPLAEMYLEALRYFSGKTSPSTAFDANDSSIISGLGEVSWSDPLSSDSACANCAIILLSTGLNSFDGDDLGSASDLPGMSGAASIDAFTDAVGVAEGIAGGEYMVGNASSGGSADTCDTKTITNFSDVEGICPEIPSLQGTYGLAGLSYYAGLRDLRTFTGEQTVNTYTVALAESLPSLEINASNGESVSIAPYCIAKHDHAESNSYGSYWGDCSLVDLTVRALTDDYGVLYISWEDSLWGSDFDMDAYAVIEYCTATGTAGEVKSRCPNFTSDERNNHERPEWNAATSGSVQFRVAVVGEATGVDMEFGYVMNGSDADGTYSDLELDDGTNNFNSVALAGTATNKTIWAPTARAFKAVAGTAGKLENPLWYAAKYGNFNDVNGNDIPDLTSEWDSKDLEGNQASDGIPDAYFPVRNPSNLEKSLSRILSDVTVRVSSGTAASVVASTGAGEGSVYQALYNPIYQISTDTGNPEVSWVGTLHSLFIDRYGNLREDVVVGGESAGQLNINDPIVEIYYDDSIGKTMVQRYVVNGDGSKGVASGDAVEITQLDPIWSAREQLGALSNYTTNRLYTASAADGRYIFTGIDDPENRDGNITLAEAVAFDASTLVSGSNDNALLLDYGDNSEQLTNLVNYIRGDESIDGFRSRSIEYDGNTANGDDPWLLGDIVNSSPVALTRPNKAYEVTYGDSTYLEFRNDTDRRRQLVFVGANDGMLHAFNSGFYDSSTRSYLTSASSETAHPLGSEVWAYIPYNLLPHLQYLTRSDYGHVYYMDGQPQVFDVNGIWDSASSIRHPAGWGNILVAGMRFGGGETTLDPDGDDSTSNDITLRSGFTILDVTDPESAPEIVAEITHPDLGYSVSIPTLVKFRARNTISGSYENPSLNEWFLIFGSGPAGNDDNGRRSALNKAESEKTAKVFAYNLKTGSLQTFDTGVTNAFVGGIEAGDWNNDFSDDAIYFGVVSGTEAAPAGQLMRGALTQTNGVLSVSFARVIDVTDQPFSAQPTVVHDRSNNFWVYGGTGRYYTSGDNSSTAGQSYYGVKDPYATSNAMIALEVSTDSLVDTTGINVFTDGSILRGGSAPVALNTGESVTNFSGVMSAVAGQSGWMFDLPYTRERSTTKSVLSNESLVFTTYQPTGETCDAEGSGFLYAPHFLAGIPGEFAPLGTDSSVVNNGAELVLRASSLGTGNPSTPTIYQDSQGNSRAIIQTSTGEIGNIEVNGRQITGRRQSWREIPINW